MKRTAVFACAALLLSACQGPDPKASLSNEFVQVDTRWEGLRLYDAKSVERVADPLSDGGRVIVTEISLYQIPKSRYDESKNVDTEISRVEYICGRLLRRTLSTDVYTVDGKRGKARPPNKEWEKVIDFGSAMTVLAACKGYRDDKLKVVHGDLASISWDFFNNPPRAE